jgi:hypothetical protein
LILSAAFKVSSTAKSLEAPSDSPRLPPYLIPGNAGQVGSWLLDQRKEIFGHFEPEPEDDHRRNEDLVEENQSLRDELTRVQTENDWLTRRSEKMRR